MPQTVHIAYLVNQYPAVSHSFIRREIRALERKGIFVHRFALRGWDAVLVDDSDKLELEATRHVLRLGAWGLAAAVLRNTFRRPAKTMSALWLALCAAKDSDRPWPIHVVYFAEACVVRLWLAETGAGHLHAHFATNATEVAMLVRKLGGPPYSFTAHGSDIMDRPAQMGLDYKTRDAAFVAAVCWFGRSQILRWIPQTTWKKMIVIGCGLERGEGHGSDALPRTTNRLLCVGRLSKEKGQALLIEAAAQLAAAGCPIDIVLAGDGPMRADIESLIATSGLVGQVKVTGWLSAQGIQAELQQARALVVPSLSEGLPVVIMEAMASRLPVIAPYLAGIPELVTTGETGWLYPSGNVDALACAMRTCLAAPQATLDDMGKTAYERVWVDHDIDIETEKLAGLFSKSASWQ